MRKKRRSATEKGQPITIRPPDVLRQRMEKITRKTGTSLTWIVLKCLEIHLPVLERQAGITASDCSPYLLNDA